jgi:phosphatidylglycerophosphate synthase
MDVSVDRSGGDRGVTTSSKSPSRDDKSYRANLRALQSAQKPARGTPAYSRYVNRPLGRRVAAALELYGLTPDGATAISAALSATGIALIALGDASLMVGIAVAALLAAGYVMDSVDGQLARLRRRGSLRGEWLDHTVDCVKTSSLHLAVAISWYRSLPVDREAALLVPLAFVVVANVTFFGLIVVPFLRRMAGAPAIAQDAAGPEHPLRKWLILPTDYGFLCLAFVLFGEPAAFFAVYTTLFALAALIMLLAIRKWWRELTSLDTARDPGTA